MFNVVADQLKVSQGWVRCGQCTHVFDAALHLHNESALSGSRSDVAQPEPIFQTEPLPQANSLAGAPIETGYVSYAEDVAAALKPLNEKIEPAFIDAPASLPLKSSPHEVLPNPSPDSELPGSHLPNSSSDVSFVRDARRQAFWRRPLIRVALCLVAVVLAGLLALQFAITQRDTALAFEPRLKPLLGELCARLACDVGPAKRIESLVIDSSSFNKINDTGAYRLTFLLKNSASTAVAMPSLEVTLTDTQDQASLRRVFTPAQLGSADGLLAAGSEFSGALTLQLQPETPPLRVAGYRLLAFYP